MERIVITDLNDTSVYIEISEEDLATLSELENAAQIPVFKKEDRKRKQKAIERYNTYLGRLIALGKYNGNNIKIYKPIQ